MLSFETVNAIEKTKLNVECLRAVVGTVIEDCFSENDPDPIYLTARNHSNSLLMTVALDYICRIEEELETIISSAYEEKRKAAQCTTTETAKEKSPVVL